MPPTLLASRARRTADANTRHAAALERATTQHHQRAITASWKHFITTTMRKDTTADYFPFVLNGLIEDRAVTASDTAAQRRRTLTNVCECVTLALNPTFSKSHPTRHRATESCAVIVLPATTSNGTHLHGFLRVPRAHRDARQVLAAALMVAFQTKNLWVSEVTELSQNGASLDYLGKTWKAETRDWHALEFLPAHLFRRLTNECG